MGFECSDGNWGSGSRLGPGPRAAAHGARTADELVDGQRHHATGILRGAVIFRLETNLTVGQAQQALTGNRNAICVAPQVAQHLYRAAERRLGVDDPLAVTDGSPISPEGIGVAQMFQLPVEAKPAPAQRVSSPVNREDLG